MIMTPTSHRAQTVAAELDQWAMANVDLIELVWDEFAPAGQWPGADELTRRHFKKRRRDYASIAREMPPVLGRLDVTQESRILLTPRALTYVPAAAGLLQAFIALVRLAIARYEDPHDSNTVTTADLGSVAADNSGVARQLEEVALLDNWLLRAAGGEAGEGNLAFSLDQRVVFVVADVQTLSEYLDLQLDAWYPDLTPQSAPAPPSAPAAAEPDPRRVMVVHGRDLHVRNDLFALLRALDLRPVEWTDAVAATGSASPYTADAVDAAFQMAKAAVILCTPDEEVLLRADLRDPTEPSEAVTAWQPRPNVYYEGGIAFTTHPTRTIILEVGKLRPASDLIGRNVVRASGPTWRQQLAQRLTDAGCAVVTSGTDWLTTGRFESMPPAQAMPRQSPTSARVRSGPPGDIRDMPF